MLQPNGQSHEISPVLSLVIASYQRAAPLNALLQQLSLQTLDKACWEVIVAVDGSTDDTLKILEEWVLSKRLPLKYFYQENQGQSVARDQAIAQAQGSRIVILDDDMEPSLSFLEEHQKASLTNPDQAVTIGKVIPQEDWRTMPLYEAVREDFMTSLHSTLENGEEPSATSFITQNVAFPKALYQAVGGFDRSLRLDEDRELGIRLERAGGRFVFAAKASAIHRSAIGSYEKWLSRQYEYGRIGVNVWKKHGSEPLLHPLRNFVAGSRLNRLLVQCAAPVSFIGQWATACLRGIGEGLRFVGWLKGGIAAHKAIIALQFHLGVKDAFGGWKAFREEEARLRADPDRPLMPTARGQTYKKMASV
jgi:glycosyltransferase involved in cell wall biosynthesis